jgi:hypothetical protein
VATGGTHVFGAFGLSPNGRKRGFIRRGGSCGQGRVGVSIIRVRTYDPRLNGFREVR